MLKPKTLAGAAGLAIISATVTIGARQSASPSDPLVDVLKIDGAADVHGPAARIEVNGRTHGSVRPP